jgi:hypothetical protein
MSTTTPTAPPGWYPKGNGMRYWNGLEWGLETRPLVIEGCTHQLARVDIAVTANMDMSQYERDQPHPCTCGRFFNNRMEEVPEPEWIRESRLQEHTGLNARRPEELNAQRPKRRFRFAFWK